MRQTQKALTIKQLENFYFKVINLVINKDSQLGRLPSYFEG
jgi:hypothetical protein